MVTKRTPDPASTGDMDTERTRLGSQTLFRGLDVVEVVAEGEIPLSLLAAKLGLTRSTAHRLASALVDRRYLTFIPRSGYSLGPKLIELGYKVRDKLDLPRIAAPYLEKLAKITEDTVQLGILDRGKVLNLDKVPGSRRISISTRIGEIQPATVTGLGKALLLDVDEDTWNRLYNSEKGEGRHRPPIKEWIRQMRAYAKAGYAYDMEESEDSIRCIAAPIRNVEGQIIAAVSISSAVQYMDDARAKMLSKEILATANRIGRDLGWSGAAKKIAAAPVQKRKNSKSKRKI